jgi:hypothetical protein
MSVRNRADIQTASNIVGISDATGVGRDPTSYKEGCSCGDDHRDTEPFKHRSRADLENDSHDSRT